MSNKKSKSIRRDARRSPTTDPFTKPSSGPRIKPILLRALFFGIFLAIFGLGMTAYRKYVNPTRPLHEFSTKERSEFMDALKASGIPTQSVWLACPEGRPEICRLVKQFIPMFQASGWRVEGNQVVQWKPAHPLGGVYLILQSTGEPDSLAAASAKGVSNSFTAIGIPVHTASAPDVQKNAIGVYFGPDL